MKVSKVVNAVTSGVLAVSLLGCASIVDGGRKTVNIKSQPSGAKATVYDKKGAAVATSPTPALFPLKRSAGFFTPAKYRIVLELQGYKTAEIEVKSTINGWYFGNIIFGGLLGLLIIDPATGAMWTLSPKEVDKVLEAGSAAITREEGGLVVMLRQDVPQELVGSLQPLSTQQ
jgi:hypothetical protein